jgi:hypothetical protein
MRPVGRAGRWAWGLCGLATAAALAVPGTRLIFSAGITPPPPARAIMRQPPQSVMVQIQTRTVIVPQPVTSLIVNGYGSASGLRGLAARLQGFPPGPIQVTAAPVTHVQVTETIVYYRTPPAVVQSVSGGRLFLADPACANDGCSVSFAVKVPPGVAVTAAGGPMYISGTSGASLDSDGLPVSVTNIHGPLTVSTHGGPLQINGLTGPLRADTGGGQLVATRVAAATAVVTTGSGAAQLAFSAAPTSVMVSTAGGLVELSVPGGPYALTANSDGALQTIGIATSSAARRSITITTGGGPLIINSGKIPSTYGPPPLGRNRPPLSWPPSLGRNQLVSPFQPNG